MKRVLWLVPALAGCLSVPGARERDGGADAGLDAALADGGGDGGLADGGAVDAGTGADAGSCRGEAAPGGFQGGVLTDARRATGGWLELPPGTTSGSYVSPVWDFVEAGGFDRLQWRQRRPAGHPLPDGPWTAAENGFLEGNADLRGSRLLMHFDRASTASSWQDSSGNGHVASCTTFCPQAVATGRFGRALRFASGSTGSLLTIPNHTTLEPQTFTVAAWVRVTGVSLGQGGNNHGAVIMKGRNNAGNPYVSWGLEFNDQGGNVFRCSVVAGGTTVYLDGRTAFPNLPTGWLHVACTYDGADARLYVNGVEDQSRSLTGAVGYNLADSNDLTLGMYSGSQRLTGDIDEVLLAGRGFGPGEVQDLYLRGALRLGVQLRPCANATCSGAPPFAGPDGSGTSEFTGNCPSAGLGGMNRRVLLDGSADCDGNGLADRSPVEAILGQARWMQARFQLVGVADLGLPSPMLDDYSVCR
ncbi:MAG: LamG domain-containing protein [Deltaproteobacteria bacterium]|nr:LamG domain-containing protein [Deltaproteobacteria bacterium]